MVGKSGDEIIRNISENVGRMLSRKMDAVKCLFREAERLSEEYDGNFTTTYYSAKYSNATVEGDLKTSNVPKNMEEGADQIYQYVPTRLDGLGP